MALEQGSHFTVEAYQLGIRRADMILVQQSASNTQLWSLLSTTYTCITSHTSSEEASSHMEVYNAALDAITFTLGTK